MDQLEKMDTNLNGERLKPEKSNKKVLTVILIAVLVLGIIGAVVFMALQPEKVLEASVNFDVPTEIEEWDGDYCVAKAGETALDIPFVPGNPEAYEIEIAYVKELNIYASGETDVDVSTPFKLDNRYIIGFNFKAKEGYEFTENTKFNVPYADNIAGADEAQFEITTRAADLNYKPITVSSTKEMDATSYTMGNQILSAHITSIGTTVYNCNRIVYTYSFEEEEGEGEAVQWDLYARTADGAIHNIHTFSCEGGEVVGDVIELDETLDINGFFTKPTSRNIKKWSNEIKIGRIYSKAE